MLQNQFSKDGQLVIGTKYSESLLHLSESFAYFYIFQLNILCAWNITVSLKGYNDEKKNDFDVKLNLPRCLLFSSTQMKLHCEQMTHVLWY